MIDLSQNTTQRQNPGTPSPAADASGPAQAPANSRAGAPDGVAPAVPTARSRSTSWAAYAACAWCIVFAAMSGYWAAGGTLGTDTISGEIKQLPGIVALLWVICVVKLIGGLIALALARPWARALPRRLLLTVAWAAGVGMTLYGGIPLIVNALMLAGLLHVPAPWTGRRSAGTPCCGTRGGCWAVSCSARRHGPTNAALVRGAATVREKSLVDALARHRRDNARTLEARRARLKIPLCYDLRTR